MTRSDDWFRNPRWDPEERASFLEKIEQSQSDSAKAEYARLKAYALRQTGDPERIGAALELLERIVNEWPEHGDLAACYDQMAGCHADLEAVDSAIFYLRKAMQEDAGRVRPSTRAWIDFALIVVRRRLEHLYEEALRVVAHNEAAAALPLDRFLAAAVRAFVALERKEDAHALAAEALEIAEEEGVGSEEGCQDLVERLQRIAPGPHRDS